MNRKILIAIMVLLVGGAAAAYIISSDEDTDQNQQNAAQSPKPKAKTYQTINDACSLVSQADAEKLLGANIEKGDSAAATQSNEDIVVSTCTYSTKADTLTAAKDVRSIAVLTRSPKTETGARSNETPFGTARPTGAQDVSGYGDKAYWDPQVGQLNVLKNGTWAILNYGAGGSNTRTLEETKKLADIVVPRL